MKKTNYDRDERYDMLDLLIKVMIDYEKTLSLLVDRLESLMDTVDTGTKRPKPRERYRYRIDLD